MTRRAFFRFSFAAATLPLIPTAPRQPNNAQTGTVTMDASAWRTHATNNATEIWYLGGTVFTPEQVKTVRLLDNKYRVIPSRVADTAR